MIKMRLATAAAIVNGQLHGADGEFCGLCGDTRKLQPQVLYFAVKGPHFDGHDFLAAAHEQGAAAALVAHAVPAVNITQIVCSDPVMAIGSLMSYWRKQFSLPIVAITGSNGKTTVKEMVASILGQLGPVLVTQGNLNNHIGVPLTLARLGAEHQGAVIEMGANHENEIAYLSAMVQPTACLINNAAAAHLEGFGDLQGVARGKGEIFQGLDSQGTGIINADDAFFEYWRGLLKGRRVLSFGLNHPADISATWQTQGLSSVIDMNLLGEHLRVHLPLPGEHNVRNALAASAMAVATKVSLAAIKIGLETLKSVPGRLQSLPGKNGARLINDSYNANPASLKAALTTLSQLPGIRVAVLGDMYELGENAPQHHRQAGQWAQELGIDQLYATGTMGEFIAAGFGPKARYFETKELLQAALQNTLNAQMTVLVKGSRGMKMETIVHYLQQTPTTET